MAAMSMSMLSGSAMATTPAITLSSSSTVASGALKLATLRSPASSSASRILAVRASHASEGQGQGHGSKVHVALVATGAALAMSIGGSAVALDLTSLIDNVKELSSNVQSSDGATEVAKRVATSAARDFTSGDADSKTSKVLDSVKELAGSLPSNQEAKDAAMDIAQNTSSTSHGNTTGIDVVVEAIKSGLDGAQSTNGVQDAAVDVAKGAAQNAAGEFANNAKNRIGAEAGKALFNAFTGSDN